MSLTVESLPPLQAEPVIQTYFTSFNQGNFAATATLFAAEGEMHAPFEPPIVGQNAIQAYLEAEATHMVAAPQEITGESLPEGGRRVIVRGTVKAIVFNVNVRWTFLLNSEDKIEQAEVKLLASLQDLVSLQPRDRATPSPSPSADSRQN